jgi:hypothetical protein
MLRIVVRSLLLSTVAWLATAQGGAGASPPALSKQEFDLQAAVGRLHRGMTEAEVREAMKNFIDDSGKIYFGGSGHSRLYLALPGKRQIWLDLGGFVDDFKVVIIGRIEPKQPWIRYGGDGIMVENLTFYF